jgi:hypothetical protein
MWWDLAFFPLFLLFASYGVGSWHWGPLNPTTYTFLLFTTLFRLLKIVSSLKSLKPSLHNGLQVLWGVQECLGFNRFNGLTTDKPKLNWLMAKWESCQLFGQKARGHFVHLVEQPSNKIKNSLQG